VRYLVATDDQNIWQQLNMTLPLLTIPGRIKHSMYHMQEDMMFRLLLDLYLLGECNEVMITPRSTFGAFASIRYYRMVSIKWY
jgi:hypothetical protein